jgi:hypothetical protein
MRVETSYGVALLLDGTPEIKDPRSKASIAAIGKRKPMLSRTPGVAAIRALTDPQVHDPSD